MDFSEKRVQPFGDGKGGDGVRDVFEEGNEVWDFVDGSAA